MRSGMTKAQLLASLFSVLPLSKPVSAASYNMVKEYAGSGFFNDWTFYDHCMFFFTTLGFYAHGSSNLDDNLTNGDVVCVHNQSQSLSFLTRLADSFRRRLLHPPNSHSLTPPPNMPLSKSTTLLRSHSMRNATPSG
jgi:hypothetical protein